MKYNVKITVLGKVINLNNTTADNHFDAEIKARNAVNKSLKFKADEVEELDYNQSGQVEKLKNIFGMN